MANKMQPVSMTHDELRQGIEGMFKDMERLKAVMEAPGYKEVNQADQYMLENLYMTMEGNVESLSMKLMSLEAKRVRFREWMTAHREKLA